MGFSAIIYFSAYKKKDGNRAIYLKVTIDQKNKKIPLDIYWPKCNDKMHDISPRYAGDPDVDDFRVLMNDAKDKANQIFKNLRLHGRAITIGNFMAHWNANTSQTDSFLEYFDRKLSERLKYKEIGWESFRGQKATYNKLKEWKSEILFCDFNEKWAYQFDRFLVTNIKCVRKDDDSTNTRSRHHKTMLTYVRLAIKDKYQFENPYDSFSANHIKGTWEPLYQDDYKKLVEYFKTTIGSERAVLRRFLFSCVTGMRLSDLKRFKFPECIAGDMIRFTAYKTRKEMKSKVIEVPLSTMGKQLIEDARKEKDAGYIFRCVTDQYSNRILHAIEKKLKIRTPMHHHAARHTFITLYLENGGHLRTAQAMAGHQQITTTVIYDRISRERIKKAATTIDMFGQLSG